MDESLRAMGQLEGVPITKVSVAKIYSIGAIGKRPPRPQFPADSSLRKLWIMGLQCSANDVS